MNEHTPDTVVNDTPKETPLEVNEKDDIDTVVHLEDELHRGSLKNVEEIDDVINRANGHETAMLRQFKWISALGLAFSITNSWVGYLVRFLLPIPIKATRNADTVRFPIELLRYKFGLWRPSERNLRSDCCLFRAMDHHSRT